MYKLSPSDFAYLYEECKHCYYLKIKFGITQPSMPMPGVFSALNTRIQCSLVGKNLQTLSNTLMYGSIVINENNELKVGSSAAYVRHDGILNITPGRSFALTLKEGRFDEAELKSRLCDRFQGKIIRSQMWIYNDEGGELNLSQQEILESII